MKKTQGSLCGYLMRHKIGSMSGPGHSDLSKGGVESLRHPRKGVKRGDRALSKTRGRDIVPAGTLGLLILIFLPLEIGAFGILINDYKNGLSPKWKEKIFKGSTYYEVIREENQWAIKATSHASASALYYETNYDPRDYPVLSWRWKVNRVLTKGDALKKEGDDYAARVYVVFPSLLFWKTRAINYIWANKLPSGEVVPNSYTSNAMMIAVQSGSKHVGEWNEERRNIFEDYRRSFGQDPPNVGAIAIMTDTDNTGEEAVAWYGPIRVLPDRSR